MRNDVTRARSKIHDDRRRGENPTRRLYGTARWQALRAEQLRREPLCRMCLVAGVQTSATVCDHEQRHGGDVARFWAGPFMSLCASHHSASKQRQERRGYSTATGADGRPLDPSHPWNRRG
jgi:hypothetical protein